MYRNAVLHNRKILGQAQHYSQISLLPVDGFSDISSGIPYFSISTEEFYAFHSIDRKLYYNLVINLRRDPSWSLHIMALFLWLERESHNSNLVFTISNSPIQYIDTIVDEAIFILTCIETQGIVFS